MKALRSVSGGIGYLLVPMLLLLVLLAANLYMDPSMLSGSSRASTLESMAPLVLIAMAMTTSILSGRGGIDLSLGPLAGFATIIVATYLNHGALGSPAVVLASVLALGGVVGAINGSVVTLGRVQPIVATLAMYLVLTGLGQHLVPNNGGRLPEWLQSGGQVGGVPDAVIIVVLAWVAWSLILRTQYHGWLLAVGQDDRCVYTMGQRVALIRIVAYALGGALAGLGGVALAALISGGDATIGPSYTLIAIAAVALGGTNLAGGSGGIAGSTLGAVDVYLINNLLSLANVQVFYVNLIYGVILIVAIASNRLLLDRLRAFVATRGKESVSVTSDPEGAS
jgi:ribose transport system permease protein